MGQRCDNSDTVGKRCYTSLGIVAVVYAATARISLETATASYFFEKTLALLRKKRFSRNFLMKDRGVQ